MTVPGEGTIAVSGRRWHEPVGWQFPGGTRVHADVDGLLRPRDTRLLDPGDNERARRQYQYNLENHIIALQTESGEHIYDYDRLYRLIQAEYEQELLRDEAYTYDGVGNRLTENGEGPWQYNKNHQLLEIPDSAAGDGQGEGEDEPSAGTTFDYDRNGHTVRKERPDGTVTLYEYDLAERLKRVKIEGGAVLGTYEYDPFGRRVSKTTAEGTIYFHYDDSGLLAEYDASGNLISEYQYRPGSPWMTDPLFKRDGADNRVHYYYNGHLGQPLKLFDRSGRITWAAEWQAFGQVRITVEETVNRLRFPGQYADGESGLFYNWNRDYDPETGRYIQSDPIGLEAGVNLYVYGFKNPISYYDPDGLIVASAAGAAIGGVVGAAVGAASAAVSGGNIGRAALSGGASGALVGMQAGLAGRAARWVGAGAAQGAMSEAFGGGGPCDILAGGLAGSVGGRAGHFVGSRNASSARGSLRKRLLRGDVAGQASGGALSGAIGSMLPECPDPGPEDDEESEDSDEGEC